MTGKVTIHPEAEREVQDAFDWYGGLSEGPGFEFLRAADAALSGIQRHPLAYQIVRGQARRVLLRKFPYALFYQINQDNIEVLACFHLKRDPIDWLRRAEP
jgi:plasmid stabilization system protein ParE